MRAVVFVDGFNLYYGCLKTRPELRWLDLGKLCRTLVTDAEITRIRYFTARISGRPDDQDGPARQDAYLRALGSLPEVTIHYGHFLRSTVWMPLAQPPADGSRRTVEVIKTEEKGSDVNLATYLLLDAFKGECDLAVVVTNDSDLAEPIRVVQEELGVPVGLLNPHPRASRALLRLKPKFVKQIRPGVLRDCQLPEEVPVGRGVVRRPEKWS